VILPDELGTMKVTYTDTAVTLSDWQPVIIDLVWDPGTADDGTELFTTTRLRGKRSYFRVIAQNTDIGAWRSRVTPTTGEVDLYLSRGALPNVNSSQFRSKRTGADGLVLNNTQFAAGQEWFLMVFADLGHSWTVFSGRAFVQDLGTLQWTDTNSSGTYDIGEPVIPSGPPAVAIKPEGMRFFKSTVPVGVPAWSLWLGGSNKDIAVRKALVPFHESSLFDRKQAGQMLVVPTYLDSNVSTYFISVVGDPNDEVTLDSRIQEVTDIAFDSVVSDVDVPDVPYRVYRVQVPLQQIAWDVRTSPLSGNPNVAIRRDMVGAEFENGAFSEVVGATDSISVVPEFLTDGAWYITVYGNSPYRFTLRNGPPEITPIAFTDTKVNDETDRTGWKYYALTDIPSQLGALGWELQLANAVPGTEIAIRRNAVPSRWRFRQDGQPTIKKDAEVEFSGTGGFLQRPGHQADIWYVGIYMPEQPLGEFVLTCRPIEPPSAVFDGGNFEVNRLEPGKWTYVRIDVPSGPAGWDIRVRDATTTDDQPVTKAPSLTVRRALLAETIGSNFGTSSATSWTSGQQWQGGIDWTGYTQNPPPPTGGSIQLEPPRIVAAMGRPLEPGTYYVGVLNEDTQNIKFTIASRGIGAGQTYPIANLDYDGGTVSIDNLAPREPRYFKVSVPSNSNGWELVLNPASGTNPGEMELLVRRGFVPDFSAVENGSVLDNFTSEVEMQKVGQDRYVLLPVGSDFVQAGDYYIAVVSEGLSPASNTIGTGVSRGTLTSNPFTTKNIGTATRAGVVEPVGLDAGQIKAYRFTVPIDTSSLEVRLDNRVGDPRMSVIPSAFLPKSPRAYGNDGGIDVPASSGGSANALVLTAANPTPGVWSVIVDASKTASASANLVVKALGTAPIAFDGGVEVVTDHEAATVRYYSVDVPAGVEGWDVRLRNVTGPMPSVSVSRDVLPEFPTTSGWSPSASTNWPSGFRWAAGLDWTGYSQNPPPPGGSTQPVPPRLVAAMGRPLEPGRYYIAVFAQSGTGTIQYTVESRGIGSGQTYGVENLAFSNGLASISNLDPREARYFKTSIPANTTAWEVTLSPGAAQEELELLVRRGAIPDFNATSSGSVYSGTSGVQVELKKIGSERYVLLPASGQSVLPADDYYLAVVSEGVSPSGSTIGTGTIGGTLRSTPFSIKDLGVANSTGTTETVDLEAGQLRAYQFTVPPGTDSLEVKLNENSGQPAISLLQDLLPIPANIGSLSTYGHNGGTLAPFHDRIMTVANPAAGVWNVVVRAGANAQGALVSAKADLVVTALTTVPLAYDGGTSTVNLQEPDTWRYFVVEVPAGVNGWDLRLRDVTGPIPAMMVRRDELPSVVVNQPPSSIPSGWQAWTSSSWPSGNQWLCGLDWTGYASNPGNTPAPPRMVMGAGRPLEPGTYYVGVYNNTTQQTTYTVDSRGIGAGRIYSVADLAYQGGSVAISELLPREARYFKVSIPANTPSWEVTLSADLGEVGLLVRRDTIPDFAAILNGSVYNSSSGFEVKMKKAGPERYVLLPNTNQDILPAGDYYIAVGGEGVNPTATTVGSDSSSGVLTSLGLLTISNLGSATLAGITEPIALKGGQIKAYQFTVPTGTESLEVRLQSESGFPLMSMVQGTRLPIPPGYSPLGSPPNSDYGFDGGTAGTQDANIQTVANPTPGIWTILVRARHDGLAPSMHPDATGSLVIKQKSNIPLNFTASQNSQGGTHTDTRQATNDEYNIYQLTVPAQVDGGPVLGWIIQTEVFQGAVSLAVYKNFADPASGITIPTGFAVVVPPYLTFGDTWYVRVKASGLTEYRITSRPVTLERPAWQMPESHNIVFGDSGTDSQGLPLPGDRGVDLAQGFWHFYALDVPVANAGLLRTELQAISGNPDLYIREDGVPTINHNSNGAGGTRLTNRVLTGATTSYGNWVPLNGKTETALKPGRWYLGVRAGGSSNVRYRLIASTGNVKNMALNASTATAQVPDAIVEDSLADNDWRYYRFSVPDNAPSTWRINFSQQVGDVVMFLRDSLPPGQKGTNTGTDVSDWLSDSKNQGPYESQMDLPGSYTFSTPPLRPGHAYYVGFRSKNSSTFSLSSGTPGADIGTLPILDFYTGVLNTTIAANSSVVYRIPVPIEATRFKYTSTHTTSVNVRVEQGTLPSATGAQHFSSSGANSSMNQALSATTWPWLPGQAYFVRLVNNSAAAQNVVFNLNGKNAQTEDEDVDGLLDAWERQYFNNLSQTGTGDPDGDGVTNAVEFADGTAPNDANSAKYTLTVLARNGTAGAQPVQAKYDKGAVVTLTNTPDAGYGFLAWAGGPFRADDFAFRATGTVTIPTSGTWTFGIHAADGARLIVNGVTVITDNAVHEARDTFGQITLTAGTYPLELVSFERTGGEALELFAAAGSFTAFNSGFRLVGDVANGGLAIQSTVNGVPVAEFVVRQVEALASTVSTLSAADTLLASTTAPRREISGTTGILNFATYSLGEGRFADDAHFPLFETVQDTPLELTMNGNYTITALNTLPLDVTLDTSTLAWKTGGNAPWLGENSAAAFDAADLAGSGPIGDGQSSIVQTVVTGPGTLTFRWKVSSQSGDHFSFSLNGTQQASITGDVDWTLRTQNISAGTHTLTWQYLKNASGSAGSDRAFLDQVIYTPN
jgi:hypothetical protein